MKEDKPTFQHPQPQSMQPAYDQIAGVQPNTQDILFQIQQIRSEIQEMKDRRITINTDLIGFFESLTAVPTGVPISPYGQIKIVRTGGVSYLYLYDYNNPTLGGGTDGWLRVVIA